MKNFIIALAIFMGVHSWAKGTTTPKEQIVNLEVTESGFQPKSLNVTSNVQTVLNVTRKTDSTCAHQIQIPSKNIKKDLPLNQVVRIEVGKLQKGEIRFGCGMNMMESGMIYVK